jgi:hypothetical protein
VQPEPVHQQENPKRSSRAQGISLYCLNLGFSTERGVSGAPANTTLLIIKYNGTLERYAGDGVMVVFNDPVPVENPALQAVLLALELRGAIGALTATWSRLGHAIGFGIGIAHGFATLGTIGF